MFRNKYTEKKMADHRHIQRPSQSNSLFLENLSNNLSTYLKDYDNILLLGNSGLRPATLLKKRLWHRCSPVNFAKFLGTLFS